MNFSYFTKTFLAVFIFCGSALSSFASTIQSGDPVYEGYRIHLTDVSVIKQDKNQLSVRFNLINTGRESVQFGNDHESAQKAVVIIDQKTMDQQLSDYQSQIKQQLLSTPLQIDAGKISYNTEFKIDLNGQTGATTIQQPEETVTTPIVEEMTENTTEVDNTEVIKEEACSDLVLENLKMIKKGIWTATVEYTIRNNGEGTAKLFDDELPLSVRITGSTSSTLNKSSVILGGQEIKEKNLKKELAPAESYKGSMKIDITNLSKYMPYLILELDADDIVTECDETNNKSSVKVN